MKRRRRAFHETKRPTPFSIASTDYHGTVALRPVAKLLVWTCGVSRALRAARPTLDPADAAFPARADK